MATKVYVIIDTSGSHPGRLCDTLYNYYESNKFTDVTIKGSDGDLFCHGVVLATFSPTLNKVLLSQSNDHKTGLNLEQYRLKTIDHLIRYMYTGVLRTTHSDSEALLELADYLEMTEVVTVCSEFMATDLNPGNCIHLYEYAEVYKLWALKEKAHAMILGQFFEVSQEEQFLTLDKDTFIRFIQDMELKVHFEDLVYDAVMRWMKHSPDTRATTRVFKDIIQHVRFRFCTKAHLTDVVGKEVLMKGNLECCKLYQDALTYHKDPNNAHELMDDIFPRQDTIQPGDIIIFGGHRDANTLITDCYKYDTLGDTWKQFTEVPTMMPAQGSTCFVNGGLFVCSGYNGLNKTRNWFYDLKKCKWERKAAMATYRSKYTLVAMDEDVLALGGFYKGKMEVVEKYSFERDTWQLLPNMLEAVFSSPAVEYNNTVYVFGGEISDTFRTKHTYRCQCYDVSTQTWRWIAAMPAAVEGAAAVVAGTDVYIVGGEPSVCYKYTPNKDQFTVLTPPSYLHLFGAAALHRGQIVLMGGSSPNESKNFLGALFPAAYSEKHVTDGCGVFNMTTNRWSLWKPSLPIAMMLMSAVNW